MQSLFLPAHTSDEETLTDTSEVNVDAKHHEEEKELQVVVWTARNSSLKFSICERESFIGAIGVVFYITWLAFSIATARTLPFCTAGLN